ncbi:hypothetical protein UFOVP1124_42 [uncultured Caudovirales phage]|uniref:Uncharacterized protein n=1 Tax=uncultured Caudovirales phage TaxID=2100421 RepID=A0A6J5QQI7_9CAUD|nr:hypothetical protein UFOVP1124_42 [uncultured Caudovirales phage]
MECVHSSCDGTGTPGPWVVGDRHYCRSHGVEESIRRSLPAVLVCPIPTAVDVSKSVTFHSAVVTFRGREVLWRMTADLVSGIPTVTSWEVLRLPGGAPAEDVAAFVALLRMMAGAVPDCVGVEK